MKEKAKKYLQDNGYKHIPSILNELIVDHTHYFHGNNKAVVMYGNAVSCFLQTSQGFKAIAHFEHTEIMDFEDWKMLFHITGIVHLKRGLVQEIIDSKALPNIPILHLIQPL